MIEVLVLGIGNVLWADEGFGVRCVELLNERWELGRGGGEARLMDGGTQGLYLVPYVSDARRVLVFDAVDFGDPPATIRVVRDGDVPAAMGLGNVSLHQVGFQDVLAACELLGKAPERITLVGVQPVMLEDYGGGLTEPVAARLGEALRLALEELRAWGVSVVPRTAPAEALLAASVSRAAYEGGRPAADVACRLGDERFLPAVAGGEG